MSPALKPTRSDSMVCFRILYAYAGLFRVIHFCIRPPLSPGLLPGSAHEGLLKAGPIENPLPEAQLWEQH